MERVPFHERQRGDLCRVHALNSLFGRVVIDEARLKEWSRRFDAHYGHHITDQFDCVQSDSLTLVSFILETQCKYVTHYLPLNSQSALEFDPLVPACMMFNAHHIWTLRKWEEGDGHWYNFDSLMGRAQRLRSGPPAACPPHTGAILVYTRHTARQKLLPLYQAQVCKELRARKLSSADAVQKWGTHAQKQRELGALETGLCNFFRVYTVMPDANQEIVQKYKNTMRTLTSALATTMWTSVLPLLQFIVRFETPNF